MKPPHLALALVSSLALACCSGDSLSIRVPVGELDATGSPVVLLYVDGLRPDVVEAEAAAGNLPVIQETFLNGGARVRDALASYPSVTFANAVTMMTGLHPGTHGIFANHWFDREALYTRSYSGTQNRERVNTDLVDPTLYELLEGRKTAVVGGAVQRGAHSQYLVDFGMSALATGVAWTAGMQEEADEEMAEAVQSLHEDANELGEWPAFTLVYFPAVDHAGHASGSDSEDYRAAIRALDVSLGRLFDSLREAGVFERSLIVLTSDHGHVPAPGEQSFDLAQRLQEWLGRPVLAVQADDSAEALTAREEEYGSHEYVLVVCGARQASLHVRTGEKWRVRPTADELGALAGSGLAQRLAALAPVDFVATRAGADAVILTGKRGQARITRERAGSSADPRYRYTLLTATDPLGYADDPAIRALFGGASDREWLAATAGQRYPDVVAQLVESFDTHRSGDLQIFAALGWDFSEHFVGGHGGLERDEVRIPMYLHGPGVAPGHEVPHARLVDLAPTVIEWIGADPDLRALDGESFLGELLDLE